MSSTTLTRQHTRSNSNAELINHSELDAIEKANQAKNSASRKVKAIEKKHQAAVTLGEIAWDKMFAEDGFDLPTTNVMDKLKQALVEEDFQQIKKEI